MGVGEAAQGESREQRGTLRRRKKHSGQAPEQKLPWRQGSIQEHYAGSKASVQSQERHPGAAHGPGMPEGVGVD